MHPATPRPPPARPASSGGWCSAAPSCWPWPSRWRPARRRSTPRKPVPPAPPAPLPKAPAPARRRRRASRTANGGSATVDIKVDKGNKIGHRSKNRRQAAASASTTRTTTRTAVRPSSASARASTASASAWVFSATTASTIRSTISCTPSPGSRSWSSSIVALVFLSPVLAIGLILWYRMRKARMLNETMLKLAEKGVVPPAEALGALAGNASAPLAAAPSAAPIYEQAKQIRRRAAWSDLRKGVILGGIGLGLTLVLDARRRHAQQRRPRAPVRRDRLHRPLVVRGPAVRAAGQRRRARAPPAPTVRRDGRHRMSRATRMAQPDGHRCTAHRPRRRPG